MVAKAIGSGELRLGNGGGSGSSITTDRGRALGRKRAVVEYLKTKLSFNKLVDARYHHPGEPAPCSAEGKSVSRRDGAE